MTLIPKPAKLTCTLFGGKILGLMPPNKVQVSFAGFGIKVILADYLQLED